MRLLKCSLFALVVFPIYASADFCDILAKHRAESCRVNATSSGAKIFKDWLRIKPEMAAQPNTGKKGWFVSATTPAYDVMGVKVSKSPKLTVDCFSHAKSMRLDALPYMLGLTNGRNDYFKLTFQLDDGSKFSEEWPLHWQRAELIAPENSSLATALLGAKKLRITTEGILGNKSAIGYSFMVKGFDEVNAGLCL